MNESNNKNTDYKKCALCGETTNVPVDVPIDKRKCYIASAGQLCRKCWFETYVKKFQQ